MSFTKSNLLGSDNEVDNPYITIISERAYNQAFVADIDLTNAQDFLVKYTITYRFPGKTTDSDYNVYWLFSNNLCLIQARDQGEQTETFDIDGGTPISFYWLNPIIASDPESYTIVLVDYDGNDFVSVTGNAFTFEYYAGREYIILTVPATTQSFANQVDEVYMKATLTNSASCSDTCVQSLYKLKITYESSNVADNTASSCEIFGS